jgi:hypothetical protein
MSSLVRLHIGRGVGIPYNQIVMTPSCYHKQL